MLQYLTIDYWTPQIGIAGRSRDRIGGAVVACVPTDAESRVSSFGRDRASGAEATAFIEEKLRSFYASIGHIGPAHLVRLRTGAPSGVLLFDVRSREEQAVSLIGGARPLDPALKPEQALERIGDVSGKVVVFYCAIGLRSSRMATQVEHKLRERGATSVYNLAGGLFRWHNEARPLVNAAGPTSYIHPYRRFWRRFLVHQDLVRELPDQPHEAIVVDSDKPARGDTGNLPE